MARYTTGQGVCVKGDTILDEDNNGKGYKSEKVEMSSDGKQATKMRLCRIHFIEERAEIYPNEPAPVF